VKWLGMNLEYSRPSSVRVNNIWNSASILPYVLSDQSLLVVEGRLHVECCIPGVARRGSHASLVRFRDVFCNEEFDHNALFHSPRYLLFAHHSSNSQTGLNRF
jgi:hypothetical protein